MRCNSAASLFFNSCNNNDNMRINGVQYTDTRTHGDGGEPGLQQPLLLLALLFVHLLFDFGFFARPLARCFTGGGRRGRQAKHQRAITGARGRRGDPT
jgi:hypothetical protein